MNTSPDYDAMRQNDAAEHFHRLDTDPEYARQYDEEIAFDDWKAERHIAAMERHDAEVGRAGACPDPNCYHNNFAEGVEDF